MNSGKRSTTKSHSDFVSMNQFIKTTQKLVVIFLTLVISSLIIKTPVYANVVINEFSPAANPEWVELHNTSNTDISLDGCTLFLDATSTSQKITFSTSDTVTATQKFKVIEKGSYNWNNFWLNNSGDTVKLSCSWGEDSVAYGSKINAVVGAPSSTEVIARSTDGTGGWIITSPTKGSTNNTSTPVPTTVPTSAITSSPTNTSTKTPTPTTAKTPTATQTLTLTPTKTAQPTPVAKAGKATPTKSEVKSEEGVVLSQNVATKSTELAEAASEPTPTPEVLTAGFFENNLPKILIIAGGIFLLSAGLLFVKLKGKTTSNGEDSNK